MVANIDVQLQASLTSLQRVLENEQMEKNWRPTWQDIKDFEAPDRGRYLTSASNSNFTEYNQGGRAARTYMIDDTPEKAGHTLAAGFQSFLTPKSRPWFRLNLEDPELSNHRPVRVWLDKVADTMNRIMGGRGTNFYPSLHNVYVEVGFFGMGAMLIERDVDSIIHCRTFTIGEYGVAQNDRGDIDTFVRQDWWTAKQLVQKFGMDRVSDAVRTSYNAGSFTQSFQVYHAIVPNEGLIPLDSPFPFLEIYWERGGTHILSQSGYDQFPVMIPRWNTVGNNVYGSECPGMRAIGVAQALQNVYEDWLIAFNKEARPPMIADASVDLINLLPDGISTVNSTGGGVAGLSPLYQGSQNLAAATEALRETRDSIKDTFFNNLFLAFTQLEGDRRTTMEIGARQEEKFVMLGPVLNSFDEDLLSVAIERIFSVMDAEGYFEEDGLLPLPVEIDGQPIDIEYTSMLAQAAKAIGNNNVDLFLQRVFSMLEADPSALTKIDTFEVINHYAESQGVPGSIIRTDEEAAQIMQAQQQQEAQARMLEQASVAAKGASDLSNAQVGDRNALETLMEDTGTMPEEA